MRYDIFETEMGWVAAVVSERGVLRMSLPERGFEQAYDHVRPEIEGADLDLEAVREVREKVQAYCAGKIADLTTIEIDTSRMSPFFLRAREACRIEPIEAVGTAENELCWRPRR